MSRLVFDAGFTTFTVPEVQSYRGFADRVHAREADAVRDVAANVLANRWLKTMKPISFAVFLDLISEDIELAEAAIRLAKFTLEHTKK